MFILKEYELDIYFHSEKLNRHIREKMQDFRSSNFAREEVGR
jgi:hypothetical protein